MFLEKQLIFIIFSFINCVNFVPVKLVMAGKIIKANQDPPSVMKPQNIKEPKPPEKPINPYFIFAADQ